MIRETDAKLLYRNESYVIQGVAFDIYKQFRNRHKEKIYQNSFYHGLREKGLEVEKEKRIDIYYSGQKVGTYMPDLVIEDKILIELKVKPKLTQDDIKQFWYYLKGSNFKLGYLINFGLLNGVEIIRRIYDKARDKA
jgi:GxxExxY protein